VVRRSVPVGLCVGVMAWAGAAQADERRVVVFTDGAKPSFSVEGDRFARGPIELEVRLVGTNPVCYRYRTRIGDKDVTPRGAPAPAIKAGAAPAPVQPRSFGNATEAREALDTAAANLENAVRDAKRELALDAMWAACEAGADAAPRLAGASAALQKNGAAWERAIADAEATARGALELTKTAAQQRADQPLELGSRRRAVEQASQNLDIAKQRLEEAKAKRAKDVPDHESNVAQATTELERARRELAEAETRGSELASAPALEADARRLLERSDAASQTLSALFADVQVASSRTRAQPSSITHRVPQGQSVKVTVERRPIERRLAVADSAAESFSSPAVEALSPIYLDVGFGPGLTLGRNTADYDLIIRENRLVAARSEQELIMDGLLSFSFYLWGPRYLDDKIFDPMQLIPRPMAAISLTEPTTSAYAGLQIDPFQFIDISGGVRWHTVDKRIGWRDTNGDVVRPDDVAMKKEVDISPFVAVTFSTDLFWRWIKRELK
jgi:hypothetical protein